MKSVTLEFPKGLTARLTNLLNAISQKVLKTEGNNIIIEFVGVDDNYNDTLFNFEYFNHIKIVE